MKGQVTQINNDTWRQPHTVHTATSHYSEVSQRCRGLKETQNPEFQTWKTDIILVSESLGWMWSKHLDQTALQSYITNRVKLGQHQTGISFIKLQNFLCTLMWLMWHNHLKLCLIILCNIFRLYYITETTCGFFFLLVEKKKDFLVVIISVTYCFFVFSTCTFPRSTLHVQLKKTNKIISAEWSNEKLFKVLITVNKMSLNNCLKMAK